MISTVRELSFVIPGAPVPKARARIVVTENGTFGSTPKKTKAYEKVVATYALVARQRCSGWLKDWAEYRLEVDVFREERKGDLDNIVKSIVDACNKVLWDDDACVTSISASMDLDRRNPRVAVYASMIGNLRHSEQQLKDKQEAGVRAKARRKSK
ncbi:MAG TPA: RusA family crossover junction endodeoxyribonuclease [Nitrospirota bacterium]